MNERCIILQANSIEAYIPEGIYKKAGRDKTNDLEMIEEINKDVSSGKAVSLSRLWELKKEVSSALSIVLETADLDQIPVIRDAVKLADSRASSGS